MAKDDPIALNVLAGSLEAYPGSLDYCFYDVKDVHTVMFVKSLQKSLELLC